MKKAIVKIEIEYDFPSRWSDEKFLYPRGDWIVDSITS